MRNAIHLSFILVFIWCISLIVPRVQAQTGSKFTKEQAEAFVQYHNKVRSEAGVKVKVTWNKDIAKFAQAWADKLARENVIQHRPRKGQWAQKYGENIFYGFDKFHSTATATKSWASEKKDYNGEPISRENFLKVGHYTQMIWKTTTQIGAGVAVDPKTKKLYVVCNYNPPGNRPGQTPTKARSPRSRPRTLGGDTIKVEEKEEYILIETDALKAKIQKKGYVSGIARNSFLDKKTGARDEGFGLHIMDFLMAPGWRDDGYLRDPKVHGNLPKHYVEGPQICTKARELQPQIIRGDGFVAVKLRFKFTKAKPGLKAGSVWEQTLVFQPGLRYILSGEQITSVNTLDNVFYRIDMPGHIRHKKGDTFSQIYLSYQGKIPAKQFFNSFGPDEQNLYQRKSDSIPKRMIRAYQVKKDGKPGPWLAGMTLDPSAVSEAWCHQRGYVCFIQELHGRAVKAGESFGAAYIVGFFDDIADMNKTYDRYRGTTKIDVRGGKLVLTEGS